MQSLHLPHRFLRAFAVGRSQCRSLAISASELDRPRDAPVTSAWSPGIHHAAIRLRERFELATRPRQALAVRRLRGPDDLRGKRRRQVEHLAQYIGDTVLAVEAGPPGERANRLHLFSEHPLKNPGPRFAGPE